MITTTGVMQYHETERRWRDFRGEQREGPGFGQKVMFKEHAFQKGTSKDFNVVSVEGVFLGWCFDTTRTVGYVKTDERVTRATTIAKLPTTETPEDEEEVPEGWRRLKDPDERIYYENLKGERQWHYPVVMEAERTAEDKGKEDPQPKRRLIRKQPLAKEN